MSERSLIESSVRHQQPDYYSNHSLKLRFPWSLYHRPIVAALQAAVAQSEGPEVLNLGSGPFLELGLVQRRGRRFTICDIDPRAVERAREIWGEALAGADLIESGKPLPYEDERFHLVVAMDVIEHVPEPVIWVREALRVLKPQGRLFLTTPNYDSLSLRVIESTALEAVARIQGFSRKHIHPTKMNPQRLASVLAEAGASHCVIRKRSLGWVLSARATKQ